MIRTPFAPVVAWPLFGSLFLMACSGSVTLGGVDQSKPLNKMTSTEVHAVANGLVSDYGSTVCNLAGVFAGVSGGLGTTGSSCAQIQQTCETDLSSSAAVDGLATAIGDCSATPADITGCTEPLAHALGGTNCSSNILSLESAAQGISMGDVCNCIKLISKCSAISGLLSGSASSSISSLPSGLLSSLTSYASCP